MATINHDEIRPGDTVRVRGDGAWLEVLEVLEEGVHVLDRASHHWLKWERISKHRSTS